MRATGASQAERLRGLHRGPAPLVLVNVWDCATARILEDAGAHAIATTSAGIAFAAGYPDGQRIPPERMLETIGRIAGAVRVPVTADVESGYGDSPEDVRRTVEGVLDAGAVGMNLEDHSGENAEPLVELELQIEKIRAAKGTAGGRGVPIVINARTDTYLRGIGTAAELFSETIRRGEAFREAGADCVFVPGLRDPEIIGALVRRLACPINVLAGSGSPAIGDLARLGVARVSLGSGPVRAAMSLLRRLAGELAGPGTYSALEGIVTHAEMNALMDPRRA